MQAKNLAGFTVFSSPNFFKPDLFKEHLTI